MIGSLFLFLFLSIESHWWRVKPPVGASPMAIHKIDSSKQSKWQKTTPSPPFFELGSLQISEISGKIESPTSHLAPHHFPWLESVSQSHGNHRSLLSTNGSAEESPVGERNSSCNLLTYAVGSGIQLFGRSAAKKPKARPDCEWRVTSSDAYRQRTQQLPCCREERSSERSTRLHPLQHTRQTNGTMIRLGKMGCGGAAAVRRGRTITALRRGLARTSEVRQVFSAAKAPPPAGARSVLCREAQFSAVSLGQQAQQGTTRHAAFGNGTAGGAIWGTLRLAMVRQRRVPLLNITTNLSNQCGHLSFVILALAYLETDVLTLR